MRRSKNEEGEGKEEVGVACYLSHPTPPLPPSLPTPDHRPLIMTPTSSPQDLYMSGSIPLVVAAWWGAEGKVSIFLLLATETPELLVILQHLILLISALHYSLGSHNIAK